METYRSLLLSSSLAHIITSNEPPTPPLPPKIIQHVLDDYKDVFPYSLQCLIDREINLKPG